MTATLRMYHNDFDWYAAESFEHLQQLIDERGDYHDEFESIEDFWYTLDPDEAMKIWLTPSDDQFSKADADPAFTVAKEDVEGKIYYEPGSILWSAATKDWCRLMGAGYIGSTEW